MCVCVCVSVGRSVGRVVLCRAISCHVMLCYVTLRYIMCKRVYMPTYVRIHSVCMYGWICECVHTCRLIYLFIYLLKQAPKFLFGTQFKMRRTAALILICYMLTLSSVLGATTTPSSGEESCRIELKPGDTK